MTERHETGSTTVASKFDPRSCELECVSLSGMVIQERLSEEPNTSTSDDNEVRIEEWTGEDETSSTLSEDQDDCTTDGCLEIAVPDEGGANFGNIVVKNSSDVRFGNNTYYQGPVTIKQFVYKGAQGNSLSLENGGENNVGFVADTIIDSPSECVKSDINTNSADKNVNTVTDNATVTKGGKWWSYIRRNSNIITCCISIVLVISIILLTAILVKKHQYNLYPFPDDSSEEDNLPVGPQEPNLNVTLSGKLKIVPRIDWLAQPPVEQPNPLVLPVPYVLILHTATDFCFDQAQCTHLVRYIQMFHIESRNWWDIGYNFLVGGDGLAYEGRGWKSEGANVYGYNAKSIGIAFIGTFNKTLPPARQILAAKQLIELGVKKNYVAKNYKLLAHRQLSPTQSPGEALYEDIKTWPHWVESP